MIYLASKRIIIVCLLVITGLVGFSYYISPSPEELLERQADRGYTEVSDIGRLFDVDQEINIPSWFTGFLALYVSLICGMIGYSEKSRKVWQSWYWRGISVIFLYISMDEIAGIHELLIDPIRMHWGLSGWLYQSWIIVLGGISMVVAALYIPFLWALTSRTRIYWILAGITYITGAIGIESLGGFILSTQGLSQHYIELAHLEEYLEMMGILIALYVSTEYLRTSIRSITIIVK